MNTNQFPIARYLVYFNLFFNIKLKKEIQFFKNYLCVVYGIQVKFLYEDLPHWYTYKLVDFFVSHKSYCIQITDYLFIVKPILKDLKHILIGPILISIDFLMLRKLNNYVYEKIVLFIRSISLTFQTFVLQIDEDGEEVLMRIQETDVFRRQKPGRTSFIKKKNNYTEDCTFFGLRYLKRKTYLFFRIVALLILPFIFYKTNQKLDIQPSEPKLAYIIGNFNAKNFTSLDDNIWKNILDENVLIEHSKYTKHNFKFLESIKIIKPRISNRLRIMNLWNANKLNNEFAFMNNDKFVTKIQNLEFDSFVWNLNNKNKTSIILDINKDIVGNLWIQKFFSYINEHEISILLYNYAFSLIKPQEYHYKLKKNNDIHHVLDMMDSTLVRYKYLMLNKIHNLNKRYFHIDNIFVKKIVDNYNLNWLKKRTIIEDQKIGYFVKRFFYKKHIWKSNFKLDKTSLSLDIKKDLLYPLLIKKKSLLVSDFYKPKFILFVEKYLNQVQHISQNMIVKWLNVYSSKSNMHSMHLPSRYQYITSLIHKHEKVLYFNQVEFQFTNSKYITNNELIFKYKTNLFSEFTTNHHLLFSFSLLQNLDYLHTVSTRVFEESERDNIQEKIIDFIPLYYGNFITKFEILKNILYDDLVNLCNLLKSQELNKKINQTLIDEQININKLWNIIYCYINHDWKSLNSKKNVYKSRVLMKKGPHGIENTMSKESLKQFTKKKISLMINQAKYINRLYSLNTLDLWQSLTNIFYQTSQLTSLVKNVNSDFPHTPRSMITRNRYNSLSIDRLDSILESNLYITNQLRIIKEYFSWFFTMEWWLFFQQSSNKLVLIIWQDILDFFYLKIVSIKNLINIKLIVSQESHESLFEKKIHFTLQTYKLKFSNFLFENYIINAINNVSLSICSKLNVSFLRLDLINYWSSIFSCICYYWFSFLLGGSSIFLWILFEKIRNLTHLSWNTELDLLVLGNLQENRNLTSISSVNKKNNLQEQYNLSLQKWSVWWRIFFSNHISTILHKIWLNNRYTSDIYGDRRDLAFELIIKETPLLNLTLSNLDEKSSYNDGYASLKQEGLDYLKQLSNTYYKSYKQYNDNFRHNQRFISFAFYKTHTTSVDLWELNNSQLKKQEYLPISLQLSHLYSKAILLIGPNDTGKSYLVKSLAADAALPLVYIAIEKLIDVLEFEDTTLESDSSLYFLRENFIKFNTITSFIKKITSCIIWMPNLEQIHYSYNNTSRTKEYCILLILRFLLQDITKQLVNHENIIYFASCEDTSYLDPGFISAKRFSRFINLRMPSNVRRPQIFVKFLKNKKLHINTKTDWYSEFSNSTMGFNLRDLTSLANQAHLISLDKKSKFLNLNDIRMVLYRGIRANENSSRECLPQEDQILLYKIGRAILQNTLVRPNPMTPLRSRYDLWKPRFYYLSKAYLQPDSLESTVTQLNILPHILSCLAGSAARDASYLLNKSVFKQDIFTLNSELIHDLYLAVNLFEGIFKEFSYLDISNLNYKNLFFIPEFRNMKNLVLIDQGNDTVKQAIHSYKNELNFISSKKENIFDDNIENISFDVSWSIKVERLSLSRNILFDLLKRVDEPLSLFSSLRVFGNLQYKNIFFEKEQPYAGIYHRSWDVMKLQISKDIDYHFYRLLVKQRVAIMALPILSDQLIEYETPENDLLLINGRPVWNPAASFLRNLVFRQRQIFANEELLSILYLLYQSQQTRSSMYRTTQRKEIWNPDKYLETLAMNNQMQQDVDKQIPIETTNKFHLFKNLAHANAIFQRPQSEVPNNSEMSFLKRFIASNRFSRFSWTEDIFYQKNQYNEDNVKLQELLIYGNMLESYYFLVKWFIRNQCLLKKIKNILLEENILFQEDLQKMIFQEYKQ